MASKQTKSTLEYKPKASSEKKIFYIDLIIKYFPMNESPKDMLFNVIKPDTISNSNYKYNRLN